MPPRRTRRCRHSPHSGARFAQLSGFSAADLDAAVGEVFDLASYRLDAWITSMAYSRLESLRTANPEGGIVLGAYGWLEDVRSTNATGGFGRIHSCAIAQSGHDRSDYAAQVILRTATQRSGPSRLIFPPIRCGSRCTCSTGFARVSRSWAARIRLERTMHDMSLDTFIDAVGAIAPMDSATNDLDVVDGLVLLQKLQDPSFWNNPGLPAAGTTQRTSLMTAIARLNDALDSVADLTLAESVHQLARGNLLRAGAALDSIAARRHAAGGDGGGDHATKRDGTGISVDGNCAGGGGRRAGVDSACAQAEPRLNAWAGALLGDPKRVRIVRSPWTAAGCGAQHGGDRTRSTGTCAAGQFPSLPEAQGVAQDLGDRIRRTAWQTRLAGAADVRLLTDRDPAWKRKWSH